MFSLTLLVCVLPRLAEHMPAAADQNNCLCKLQSRTLLSCCSQERCCQRLVSSAAAKLQSRALLSNCSVKIKSTALLSKCSQERSCFLQCVGVWGVGLGARRPGPCWWPLPVLLRHTSWASKCGSATTATLTSDRMEVRVSGADTSLYDLIDWQQQVQLYVTFQLQSSHFCWV